MSWYEERILPHLTNLSCSTKPIRKQREKIVPLAEGDVLEIGVGTGLNLRYYEPGKINRIWALEPSGAMRKLAAKKLRDLDLELNLEFIELPGEKIPLESASVDTVLVTYTLCTIPDAMAALQGMRRVLKPGGRLLFSEHGAAPDENVRRWQERLNSGWRKIAGGCNLNRDIPAMIRGAGFDIVSEDRMYIPGPKILSYNFWGSATPG
jgi:ubiquinone/menaquinone biosynthesis C-methylase UbiE